MTFLNDDEHLLLMNLSGGMLFDSPLLQLGDRQRLHDAGLLTAIEYPEWRNLEPTMGHYDFSTIEWMLDVNRKAGLKTLFSIPGPFFPTWIPDDWKFRYDNGSYNTSAISFWSRSGQDYLQNFMQMLISRYKASDVNFFFGELDTGESIYPGGAYYDDRALADFHSKYGDRSVNFKDVETQQWLTNTVLEHYVEVQSIFYPQYQEIWDAHQWLIAQKYPPSMNHIQPLLLKHLREHFPNATLFLLQYTYFDDSHPQANVDYVDKLKKDYDCQVIVEAMFCSGLPSTTPKSIAKGFRGQIVCPTHQHTQKKQIETWMLDNIRTSIKQWRDGNK